jgi:hypothetical protein
MIREGLGLFVQTWQEIWSYKVSLVPVLSTYLVFDLPAIARRVTRVAYVPIYFLVYPSGHSDQLYAEYLNEDDFYGIGETLSEDERNSLRKKIQATAVFSMVFAAIFAPWVCGFISAFYLQPNQFAEFLVFFFVVKTFLLSKSLWNLRGDSRAALHGSAFLSVVGVYFVFLLSVWYGLTKSIKWTHANIQSDGFVGLFISLLDYAYANIFIGVGVVSALTWAFTVKFTDPKNITPRDGSVDESSSNGAAAS